MTEQNLRHRSLEGFVLARQQFLHERQIGQVLQLVEQYRYGVRGYDVCVCVYQLTPAGMLIDSVRVSSHFRFLLNAGCMTTV